MKVCLLELSSDDNLSTGDEKTGQCLVRTGGPSKKVILYGRRAFRTKIRLYWTSGTMQEAWSATIASVYGEICGVVLGRGAPSGSLSMGSFSSWTARRVPIQKGSTTWSLRGFAVLG